MSDARTGPTPPPAAPPAPGPLVAFAWTVRAEWTKLRSVRGTAWSALAVVLLSVLLSALVCASISTEGGSPDRPGDTDVVLTSLSGVYLGQIAIVALAVLAVTSEYATRMIRVTFLATPGRRTVLAAKAAVVGAVALGAGMVTSLTSFLVGQAILPGQGFVAANGYPPASLADGPTLRAVAGTGLYLTLLALLSLGVGAVTRHTAGAITIMLGLLYVPTMALAFLPAEVGESVQRYAPMTAGLAVQVTTGGYELFAGKETAPIGPWAGLGVVGAYAAAALLTAGWLLARRDA